MAIKKPKNTSNNFLIPYPSTGVIDIDVLKDLKPNQDLFYKPSMFCMI